MEIEAAVKYYILKSVNLEKSGLIKDFNINDFNIKKTSKNTYSFLYTESTIKNDFSIDKLITGSISKYNVKVIIQKRICIKEKEKEKNISLTTFKNDEYSIIDNDVLYTTFYSTTKRINDSNEFTESLEKLQKYDFRDKNLDLLNNFENLVSKKWPIIKNSDLFKDKKLVKKCWL